jgi:molybdopterin molybdotransferase
MDCNIIHLGIIGDTLEATKQALASAANKADLVITTGGVSVGEEDHVRIALEAIGKTQMWRLNIKPGKPLVYGTISNTAFIGLPGNPVSAFVTFCLFVCPHLKKMQNKLNLLPTSFQVKAQFNWLKPDSRREFLRARLSQDDNGKSQVDIYKQQGSGVLMSTSWATGVIEVEENSVIKQGDHVNYIPYSEFLS